KTTWTAITEESLVMVVQTAAPPGYYGWLLGIDDLTIGRDDRYRIPLTGVVKGDVEASQRTVSSKPSRKVHAIYQ
ncbi:hypothetical protein NL676_007200, partial [Syzygium grande]